MDADDRKKFAVLMMVLLAMMAVLLWFGFKQKPVEREETWWVEVPINPVPEPPLVPEVLPPEERTASPPVILEPRVEYNAPVPMPPRRHWIGHRHQPAVTVPLLEPCPFACYPLIPNL